MKQQIITGTIGALTTVGILFVGLGQSVEQSARCPEASGYPTTCVGYVQADLTAEAALAGMSSVLDAIHVNPSKMTPDERVLALDKSDPSALSLPMLNSVYVNRGIPSNLLPSMFQTSVMMESAVPRDDKGALVTPPAAAVSLIVFDAKRRTADIPLAAFGASSPMMAHMVYVDGAWKLDPLPTFQSIALMNMSVAAQEKSK